MAASGTEDDVGHNPEAYNQSIYLLVGVPYASFGIVAFMIYRGCKKNAAYFESLAQAPDNEPKN